MIAIRRINAHETFADWLAVGQACLDMRTAAMQLAHLNRPKGRVYNDAFKVIAHEVPDLAKLQCFPRFFGSPWSPCPDT